MRAGLLTLFILAPAALLADDFLTSGSSARSTAAAGVYIPTSDNVLDAMAINPAGLAMLSGARLDFSLKAALARGSFSNSANTDAPLHSAGVIPYGAFGTPLGSEGWLGRVTVGAAVLPELLSAAKWRYVDAPGGAGGVSYGMLNQNSEIVAIRTAFGAGIAVNSRLMIGATAGLVYNTNTLQTAYVFQQHPALAGLKTLLDLHTSGTGWNGSVGAIVRPLRSWQIGAAYKSRTTIRSTGTATGNAGIQFAKIGLGAARPDFRYDGEVDNTLPQSATFNVAWQAGRKTRIVGQADWINWRRAFRELPVNLTRGNNADINGLLGTDGIRDAIPLDWKNQLVTRVGVERSWLESASIRAGYAHSNNPVPSSTLSPLTAAITRHTLGAGVGYTRGRWRTDLAYSFEPTASAATGLSALKSGEYNNSRVKVGTQSLVLSTSIRVF